MSWTFALWCAAAWGQNSPAAFLEVGRLSDPQVREASALETSRRFPGVFWTVADSGNPPHLVALDRTGQVLATYRVSDAVNLDWECLAVDDAGRLYIGDLGNNQLGGRARLPQRWVYVTPEPDPRTASENAAPAQPRPLALERTVLVRYPEAPFDVEGAFTWRGRFYVISKTPREARVYRLPQTEGEAPVTWEKVAELPGLAWATGAALSPDGRRLAVCTYTEVWIYTATAGETFVLESNRPWRRLPYRAAGVEACAWDGDELLLLSESGRLYRLSLP